MTTRILIFLSLCWVAAAAEPPSSLFAPPTVGVLLKFERQPPMMFVKALQHQVGAIFRPSSLDLKWELLRGNRQPGTYDRVVVIEMRGVCDPNQSKHPEPAADARVNLGWTIVNDGEVLPYAVVDCDQITRVLSGAPHRGTNFAFSAMYSFQSMYNRLASRVLAHELMHVLLRTSEHHQSDCMRSPLRPIDLATEPRLQPSEIAALREIMRTRGETLAQRD